MIDTNDEPQFNLIILTRREKDVLRKVLQGHSNKQIAFALNIAEHTVKIHLQHVYSKLHVHGRIKLVLHFPRGLDPEPQPLRAVFEGSS